MDDRCRSINLHVGIAGIGHRLIGEVAERDVRDHGARTWQLTEAPVDLRIRAERIDAVGVQIALNGLSDAGVVGQRRSGRRRAVGGQLPRARAQRARRDAMRLDAHRRHDPVRYRVQHPGSRTQATGSRQWIGVTEADYIGVRRIDLAGGSRSRQGSEMRGWNQRRDRPHTGLAQDSIERCIGRQRSRGEGARACACRHGLSVRENDDQRLCRKPPAELGNAPFDGLRRGPLGGEHAASRGQGYPEHTEVVPVCAPVQPEAVGAEEHGRAIVKAVSPGAVWLDSRSSAAAHGSQWAGMRPRASPRRSEPAHRWYVWNGFLGRVPVLAALHRKCRRRDCIRRRAAATTQDHSSGCSRQPGVALVACPMSLHRPVSL